MTTKDTLTKPKETVEERSAAMRGLVTGPSHNGSHRPGHYLETPQRWGLLPTLGFWNRQEVRRAAWPFLVLFLFLGFRLTSAVFENLPWWSVLLGIPLAYAPVFLGIGLLERYIRRRAYHRTGDGNALRGVPIAPMPTKGLSLLNPRFGIPFVVILGLAIILFGQWRLSRVQAERSSGGATFQAGR